MDSIRHRWRHLWANLAPRVWLGVVWAVLGVVSTATFLVDEAGARRPPLIAWLPAWGWAVWALLAAGALFCFFFEGTLEASTVERRLNKQLFDLWQGALAGRTAEHEEAETELRLENEALRAELTEARNKPREALMAVEIQTRLELADLITRISRHARGFDKTALDNAVPYRAGHLKDHLSHYPEAAILWRDFMQALTQREIAKVRREGGRQSLTAEDVKSFFLDGFPEDDALDQQTIRFRDWLMMREPAAD